MTFINFKIAIPTGEKTNGLDIETLKTARKLLEGFTDKPVKTYYGLFTYDFIEFLPYPSLTRRWGILLGAEVKDIEYVKGIFKDLGFIIPYNIKYTPSK